MTERRGNRSQYNKGEIGKPRSSGNWGNIPDSLGGVPYRWMPDQVPDTWTPDQISAFRSHYDDTREILALPNRSDEDLEDAWQRATNFKKSKIADPLITLDSQCKFFEFWRDISCEDFSRMLELLALVTGDAIFSDAATRMKKHGFVNGRIKTNSNRMARECLGRLDAIAMPCIHNWLEFLRKNRCRESVTKAAKLAAIDLKIPGSNFNAVTQSLRKKYASWVKDGGPRKLVKP
jgi:hypothetical protein